MTTSRRGIARSVKVARKQREEIAQHIRNGVSLETLKVWYPRLKMHQRRKRFRARKPEEKPSEGSEA